MELTRRSLLKSSGIVAAGLGLEPLFPGSLGGHRSAPKTLVIVFLRGGADGLSLLVPHAEEAYYRLRSQLAIPRPGSPNGALDLDGFFGLHPRARALLPFFEAGLGVALPAVGNAHNTRSHFEEQDVWETGVIGNTLESDGWLNRHLRTGPGHGPVRAVSFGDSLPRILRGDQPAYVVRALDELGSDSNSKGRARAAALVALESAHAPSERAASNAYVTQGGRAALEALRELKKIADHPYDSQVSYPDTGLGRRFRDVARAIRADVGVEVCELDFGGWDTHQNQGGAGGGPFANLVAELSEALAAFLTDLDDRRDDVLVLTLSEFGRTAMKNGTNGTDHGWANCVLGFGGAVQTAGEGRARHVIGEWPGLERDQLNQGRDLRHTTDFRDVLAEVVQRHLKNDALEIVLPGHAPQPAGLI